MLPRSNSTIIPGYLFLGIAGILFIMVPPTSVSAFYIHNNIFFIEIFGAFFALGGFTALVSTLARKLFKANAIATWYFEMAGLFLIISANIIYAYSLCTRGVQTNDINTFALGLLFIGISLMTVTRLLETRKLLTQANKVEREKDVR